MPPKGRAPARKAAPAKAQVAEPVDKVADRIEMFEALRARAHGSQFELRGRVEPLVMNAFDPPVTATFPTTLEGRLELDSAARDMNLAVILRIFLGDQLIRVIRQLDQAGDSDALALGLVLRLLDHFNGVGAGDVPGGIPAS